MGYFYDSDKDEIHGTRITAWTTVLATAITAVCMAGCPVYHVWQQEMQGRAELSRATFSRKILVQEAEAKKESAKLLGEAEVARAHGLAEANQIVGKSLGGPENYIRYLWIQQIDKVSGQVIYVPTEAGLPLTEATRLQKPIIIEKEKD